MPALPPVAVLTEHRYREQLQPAGVIDALAARGHDVRVVTDTAASLRRLPLAVAGAGAVVMRGRSPRLLRAAARLAAMGTPVVDPAAAVAAVRDKARMGRRLRSTGMPIPRSWRGHPRRIAERVPDFAFPVVCKPVFGDNGHGVVIVRSRAELRSLPWQWPDALVQTYIANDGADLKLYVIGAHVSAVRKPSPLTGCRVSDLGQRPLTPELLTIADRCRQAFGLTVFGVDLVEQGGRHYVIEINDFPNFTSVPRAGDLLAEHVLRAGGGTR